jgi:hypothetical protein
VLVVATPTGNQFFSTVALSADLWVLAIGLSAVGFVAIVGRGRCLLAWPLKETDGSAIVRAIWALSL